MYGLQVFGEHGVAQIDGNYRNLVLINKQTMTLPLAPPTALSSVKYTKLRADSIVAVRKLSNYGTTYETVISVFNVRSTAGGDQVWVLGNNDINTMDVIVYEFAFNTTASNTGYGLVVRNASNEVVFNSNDKPLKVVGMSRSSDPILSNRPSITLPSDRDYAVALPEATMVVDWSNGVRRTLYGSFTQQISGSNYIFKHAGQYELIRISGSGQFVQYVQNMLVIDVTNY